MQGCKNLKLNFDELKHLTIEILFKFENIQCLNFKVFQELAFYSHTTFKAHLLGLLGQHILGFDSKTVQRSALCRSRRELPNEYLLAKFGFDTAENEPI